ncbi:MAG: NADP-dependent malic enzyme [Candidatus Sericytochromatia bacterium]|nr:NADP-dependent malic enzyme [Candidatus Sericytochromatia bacterium]
MRFARPLSAGKISVRAKAPLKDDYILSLVYSPGVAEPCRMIAKHPETVYDYTVKGNFVAVVSDGSAVLGLGNLGPLAVLPILEGKATILKCLAGIDALPIALDVASDEEFVAAAANLQPTFGGILLDDVAAPRCFRIEKALQDRTNIPVLHDDQHGTAIVVLAGLLNALKAVGKDLQSVKIVVSGTGAAGIAVAKLLLHMGVEDLILADEIGLLYEGRTEGLDFAKEEMAFVTNPQKLKGTLAEAVRGADVLIGLSVADIVTHQMVASMAEKAIVFALANPHPEIAPNLARAAGAVIAASGGFDDLNTMTNVLAFPGLMRGCLDVRATTVTNTMKIAAAKAIAGLVAGENLERGIVLPRPLDLRVPPAVAMAVARSAIVGGVAQLIVNPEDIATRTRQLIYGDTV